MTQTLGGVPLPGLQDKAEQCFLKGNNPTLATKVWHQKAALDRSAQLSAEFRKHGATKDMEAKVAEYAVR